MRPDDPTSISPAADAAPEVSPFLKGFWYLAVSGQQLRPGRLQGRTLLGEPVVLGRRADGTVFALRDICPHRALPLSFGHFDGVELECGYHGWRFDGAGQCTAIPSLLPDQPFDPSRIRVRHYPCREVQGAVWVFFGQGREDEAVLPDPEAAPGLGDRPPQIAVSMSFECGVDEAVIGLVDPAHGPFVHSSWWWRSRRSIHQKVKSFAPSPLGFTMVRHTPSRNSAAYRLLGGELSTEITFRLPGVRLEHIRAGRHAVCNLTAVTPINERRTLVHNLLYWTQPWLAPMRWLFSPVARAFLDQDRRMLSRQQIGLSHRPPMILVDDADTQAKWYFRLKKEWRRVEAEGGEFRNPVKPTELRWQS